MQIGALVELTRVLMQGPVIAGVAALQRTFPTPCEISVGMTSSLQRANPPPVAWFVIAFLVMMVARSSGLIDDRMAHGAAVASTTLT